MRLLIRGKCQIWLISLLDQIRCKLSTSWLTWLWIQLWGTLLCVWEGLKKNLSILVNSREFKVSDNLYNLLSRIRRCCENRILWIDQIYINQEDDTEQIGLMVIYTAIVCKLTRVSESPQLSLLRCIKRMEDLIELERKISLLRKLSLGVLPTVVSKRPLLFLFLFLFLIVWKLDCVG